VAGGATEDGKIMFGPSRNISADCFRETRKY
jgi:hypothetical protein